MGVMAARQDRWLKKLMLPGLMVGGVAVFAAGRLFLVHKAVGANPLLVAALFGQIILMIMSSFGTGWAARAGLDRPLSAKVALFAVATLLFVAPHLAAFEIHKAFEAKARWVEVPRFSN